MTRQTGPSTQADATQKSPHNRRASQPPRNRVRALLAAGLFAGVYGVILTRLVWFGAVDEAVARYNPAPPSVARPDILDRNGEILATDVPSFSVYAEPRRIVDVDEAVEKIMAIFPDLNASTLHRRLSGNGGFTWVKRTITPRQQQAMWEQGVPGVGFRRETRRLYPNGPAAAQVLGAVNIDNKGIAGIERWIDRSGLEALQTAGMDLSSESLTPVELSVDLKVQHAFTDSLKAEIDKYEAVGGAGLVLDVTNGEVLSLVSIPDFDPNDATQAQKPENINRINVGVYEMGSTFKAMTTAMALDSGIFNIHSVLDASRPLSFGRFRINDFRGENRPLNVPEAFLHSSNIAFGRMAMGVGVEGHQAFLRKLGQLDRLTTELPESASPIVPRNWQPVNTATIAFGHGLAVTPLQAAMGIGALVNGGHLYRPTFVKGSDPASRIIQDNVVTPQSGEALRYLMRLNAITGSAKGANLDGYYIGGKTGTAEKVINGRYERTRVMTSFMGILPANDPKYLFLVILDEPKPVEGTHGFRTSGWNAVPAAGRILSRILPIMHMPPTMGNPQNPFANTLALRPFGYDRIRMATYDAVLANY
ncbi:peptidoglycan D,D-transpeptidase FtsI family protein [Aureimonas mangrovi]|uniref:peptidoglycan D,D-transpeptidase FtsI family protein n=1 Tax=Aureimonas mangrovi TaxID=2758041 RepID=UPI00163D974C|nr:penicillin-binding protein 2 [Aureimonas mangrovi]